MKTRSIGGVVSALLVLLPPAPALAAATLAASCGNIQILSDELSASDAKAYCAYALAERQKVEQFWGATWTEPIRIHVARSYRISKALIPAWRGDRGFMEMPLRGVRNNDGALLHEIVHIYAPNGNRFLAEGLAVHLHDKLAGNGAFPNFRKPLAAEARARLSQIGSLAELDGVRTPRPLGTVLGEQSAYTLAGSFVGFLIEKYGLPEFRKLYDGGTYDGVYSKSLHALEQEWRTALQQ